MGKLLGFLFGSWAFVLSGFNPVVAVAAATAGGLIPEKRKRREVEEYRYDRETKLTHYPDGTVRREEREHDY